MAYHIEFFKIMKDTLEELEEKSEEGWSVELSERLARVRRTSWEFFRRAYHRHYRVPGSAACDIDAYDAEYDAVADKIRRNLLICGGYEVAPSAGAEMTLKLPVEVSEEAEEYIWESLLLALKAICWANLCEDWARRRDGERGLGDGSFAESRLLDLIADARRLFEGNVSKAAIRASDGVDGDSVAVLPVVADDAAVAAETGREGSASECGIEQFFNAAALARFGRDGLDGLALRMAEACKDRPLERFGVILKLLFDADVIADRHGVLKAYSAWMRGLVGEDVERSRVSKAFEGGAKRGNELKNTNAGALKRLYGELHSKFGGELGLGV